MNGLIHKLAHSNSTSFKLPTSVDGQLQRGVCLSMFTTQLISLQITNNIFLCLLMHSGFEINRVIHSMSAYHMFFFFLNILFTLANVKKQHLLELCHLYNGQNFGGQAHHPPPPPVPHKLSPALIQAFSSIKQILIPV